MNYIMPFIFLPLTFTLILPRASPQLLTYGRRIPLAEMFARIDAVDVDTVKRVADRFLMDKVGGTQGNGGGGGAGED